MGERVGQIAKAPEVKQSNSNSRVRRTKRLQSMNTPVDRILYLQRTAGNQAVSRLMRSGALQAKLRIGQPGDVYEQEADRVADAVMRMPEPGVQRQPIEEEEEEQIQTKPVTEQITPLVQRQTEEEEEEELRRQPIEEEEEELQAKTNSGRIPEVQPNNESRIHSLKGGGQPLPESTRAHFEPRFGRDFSRVRVHSDTQAAEAARAVNARAFTMGREVVFGAGQYAPESSMGQRLMAHELTHVVQQNTILVNRKEDVTASVEFMKEGWNEVNEVGIVYQESGANLRDKPLPEEHGSKVIHKLSQNTKVFILKHDKKNKWFAVGTVSGKKGGGEFGYVADWLIWRKLPEPDVEIYKIKQGDYPLLIAAKKYKRHFREWGKDLRYVVNALVYVNTTSKHNGTGELGLRKIDNNLSLQWFFTASQRDVYIWLPSPSFLSAMYKVVVEKGGGTGSITADIWQSVKKGLEKLAYGAAFIGGLIHGFIKSIYDAVVGIVKMIIDLLVSIFSGSILEDAKKLWDAVSKLTWKDIKDAVGDWAIKWGIKLESSSPWVAGHAYGYLVGYVMGEAAMILVSYGALAAAKIPLWATKFGKAIKATKTFQKLAKGIEKAQKTAGKGKELFKKAAEKLKGKKVPIIAKLFKISKKMQKKILWGERVPGTNKVIGGHFRGIIGHPKYATEIIGTSNINPRCIIVKFTRELPGGMISNLKKSTMFPRGWSKRNIIKAIETVANNPTTKVISGGATKMQGKVRGVTIEVIVRGGKIVSGYPL